MNTGLPTQNAGAYLTDTAAEFDIVHRELQSDAEFDFEDCEIYGLGAMVTPPNLLNFEEAAG